VRDVPCQSTHKKKPHPSQRGVARRRRPTHQWGVVGDLRATTAVGTAEQVAEKVGIGEPTQAIETHSRRMAARAPLEAPLILGVRY